MDQQVALFYESFMDAISDELLARQARIERMLKRKA